MKKFKKLKNKLRSLRLEAGYTQIEFAIATDVHFNTIRQLEHPECTRAPTLEKCLRFATVLNVELHDIWPAAKSRRGVF